MSAKRSERNCGASSCLPDSSPDLARLIDLVSAFPRQTIVVVGDFVVDEFVSGEISRVSREAPVLILRHRQTEVRPGGGANAVNNLVDLGARVRPVGAVGDDARRPQPARLFSRQRRGNVGDHARAGVDYADQVAVFCRMDAHHRAAGVARGPGTGVDALQKAAALAGAERRGSGCGARARA